MTKEQLRQYRSGQAELVQLRELLCELEGVMTAPPTARLTGAFGGAADGSRTERLVERKAALETRYRAKQTELLRQQADIETAIETLEPVERQLLRYRYLLGLTWEEVSDTMHYSWRQVHNIHARALERLRDR